MRARLALVACLAAWPLTVCGQEEVAPGVPHLTLPECIEIALRNQLAIAVKQSNANIADQEIRVAGSRFMPQVDFNGVFTHIDEQRSLTSENLFTGAQIRTNTFGQNFLRTQLFMIQPLWQGGELRYRYAQSNLNAQSARWDLTRTSQETVFNVSRAYLSVLLAEGLAQVAQETADFYEVYEVAVDRAIRQAQEELQEEPFSKSVLYQLRSARLRAEGEAVQQQRLVTLAYARMHQAMGVAQKELLQIADETLLEKEREVDLDGAVQRAFALRPELRRAEIDVQEAWLDRQLALSNFQPDVSAFGYWSTLNDDQKYLNPNDPGEVGLGLQGNWALFNGGRRLAQTRQASFAQTRSRRVRDLLQQVIELQVYEAYTDYVGNRDRLQRTKLAQNDARKNIEYADKQFLGDEREGPAADAAPRVQGIDPLSNLFRSRGLLTTAQVEYIQQLYNCNLALAQLRLATASDEYRTFHEDRPPRNPVPSARPKRRAAGGATQGKAQAEAEDGHLLQSSPGTSRARNQYLDQPHARAAKREGRHRVR